MNLYLEHYVTQKTERFINKIWCLDNSIGESLIENKLVLPNGCFNLAIVTGKAIEVHTSKNKYEMNEGVYFCSQMTNKVLVNIEPKTKVTIIQFHTWTLSMFPKYDLSNFTDSIIKINPEELPFNLQIDSDIERLLQTINVYFEELSDLHSEKNTIEKICEIIKNQEEISVADISKNLKLSQRLLQIKFKTATGLTIKKYIQILKFRKAVDQMVNADLEKLKLTDVALYNKYFDQSHFIKKFKDVMKTTPKTFDPDSYFLSLKR
ncbi:helix-turn-helix domain-containing protein [Flavobacterium johnsoniae]|uniref:Helix-turn-helix-domain containing protein, AraC type n=1 Tax=Flavobacterium johnsoniae (strain ATCC 17061 / DSM 2064 / JCM 8514 / BCRC 14874 / CCUG 350202 / NBRC 14942 / NCIMB 11054 / UW101) TaxID=376686 RepID=A5FMN2_FLAJ1|nr:AraC family transcriptional regulator [Flavobacterium johnsoniae]ABQ03532.1 helix-turn-helix- domain containing protein, AraC type [Flavobacterium johnsoniae UW101]OXE95956.1 DNA-binding protein [Flavobacterium johnsoniae UW101]WQG79603.1 AraC family transcriptional regulator [Flavobacterium johnsoniae UW101]SHL94984.1 AraC-type DNA-binding protein [Flavobacterium johnsoniae]